jgi:hypothetical protein
VISTLVVGISLAMAVAYFVVWLLKPGFRNRIERPKYEFQKQLDRFDRQSQ